MIFLTSPGKTYSVNSVGGCTISAGGTTLATIPANVQTTFIAPDEEVLVSDNNAIIVEVTGVGAGGSGTGGSTAGDGVSAADFTAHTGNTTVHFSTSERETMNQKFSEIDGRWFNMMGHMADTTAHITQAERTKWNAAADNSGGASSFDPSANPLMLGGFANGTSYNTVAIGGGTFGPGNTTVGFDSGATGQSVSFGFEAEAYSFSTAIGRGAIAGQDDDVQYRATAVGCGTVATGIRSTAIGANVTTDESGVVVIGTGNEAGSIYTQLFLLGAGSPLATALVEGEAALSYVVKEKTGNILSSGTRRLSELLGFNVEASGSSEPMSDKWLLLSAGYGFNEAATPDNKTTYTDTSGKLFTFLRMPDSASADGYHGNLGMMACNEVATPNEVKNAFIAMTDGYYENRDNAGEYSEFNIRVSPLY